MADTMTDKSSILTKLSTLRNLPTLPHILIKLIRLCNKDEVSLKEVSDIIEKDTSLSAKILKLVNSSCYGLPRDIKDIYQAVTYLGMNTVKNIAVSASICQAFHPVKDEGLFNLKVFWWHSLRCAVLGRLVAKKLNYENLEDAFLAGMLHDIGKLVLWVNFPREYSALLNKYKGRSDLLLAGEIRFGITHCEVGAWLLNQWGFQSLLSDALLYHHESLGDVQRALPIVQIVYSANILAHNFIGGKNSGLELIRTLYGFDIDSMLELIAESDEELEEVAKSLEIPIEHPRISEESESTRISDKDRKTRNTLAREVRDLSLLFGTLQNIMAACNMNAILQAALRGINILFDMKDVIFLTYDVDQDRLVGEETRNQDKRLKTSNIIVPMKLTSSLPVMCLVKHKPVSSFDNSINDFAVTDVQLIRIMGKEGVLCLPLIAYSTYMGVILIGLDKTEFSSLDGYLKVLEMLADQVAFALYADKAREMRVKKVQAERLLVASSVARKIVNDLDIPVALIKEHLKIIEAKLMDSGVRCNETELLHTELERIDGILDNLKSFSSEDKIFDTHNVRLIDINTFLSDILYMLKYSLAQDDGINIRFIMDKDLPPVKVNKGAFKQLIMILLKNAAEAMRMGGTLFVKTRYLPDYVEDNVHDNKNACQGYAEILVVDNGPGMEDEIRNRIFEPFITTKGKGHDSLGLSVAYSIVKALGGTIVCDSEKGKGTVFKISLPITISSG